MTVHADELLARASDIAREAGALLRERSRTARTFVGTKSTATDMVTEVDRESEALVVERILYARPDDAILAEEGSARDGTSGVRWVIDPLDGTTNFLYGHPPYAVSIAAEVDGEAVAGAVFNASSGELFSATLGGGAFLDGEPIFASRLASLALALVGTGFGYDPPRRAIQGALLARVVPQVRDIRRAGSAALDLCSVACGRLDAYYEQGLAPWDRAAGELIAREAGGLTDLVDLGNGLPQATIAAGPGVFAAFRAMLLLECTS